MKKPVIHGILLLCLLVLATPAQPQDKPTKEEPKSADVRSDGPQLRVQIVFSEYEGDKKIKSLPYTLLVRPEGDTPWSKIRMGSRVPVYLGNERGSMQYFDVGTNIDCRANVVQDGRYRLLMILERSWVEGEVLIPIENRAGPSGDLNASQFREPIIRQFRSDNNVTLRDGQTMETNLATDPVSGKVVKLEVSISVVK
jgi:hypothetical protein